MPCLSSSSCAAEGIVLTDSVSDVQHDLPGRRSVLPPAPTSSQLLSVLHEAAQLLPMPPATDTSTVERRSEGVSAQLEVSSASLSPEYASYIRRQCPTSRRVQSSFAAAGAHSMLGEMLQFFAVSLTRLFTEGVESEAVLSFPTEWEQRLNAPSADALREKYLYELQGFSTLFTYLWGCVAASHPPACLPKMEDGREGERGRKEKRSARVSTAAPSPSTSLSPSPISSALLPCSSAQHKPNEGSDNKVQQETPTAVAVDPVAANGRAPPRPQLVKFPDNSKTQCHDSLITPSSNSANQTKTSNASTTQLDTMTSKSIAFLSPSATNCSSRSSDTLLPGSARRKHSLTVFKAQTAFGEASTPSHGLKVAAKGRGHFLPSLTLEGIVPPGQLPRLKNSEESAPRGREKGRPRALSLLGTSPPLRKSTPHISPSAKQLAIQQLMEQERERELKRALGVRNVRNFAKEDDMQGYLQAFQKNMLCVLGDEEDREKECADSEKW